MRSECVERPQPPLVAPATPRPPQVAALAWISLGCQFALAVEVGSIAHMVVMASLVRLTYSKEGVERARKDAADGGERHGGMQDPAEGLPRPWRANLSSGEIWRRI